MIVQERVIAAASLLRAEKTYTVHVIIILIDEFDEDLFLCIPYAVVTDAQGPTTAAVTALQAASEHAENNSDRPTHLVAFTRVVSIYPGKQESIHVDLDYDAIETNLSRLPEIDHIFPKEEVSNPSEWATTP